MESFWFYVGKPLNSSIKRQFLLKIAKITKIIVNSLKFVYKFAFHLFWGQKSTLVTVKTSLVMNLIFILKI